MSGFTELKKKSKSNFKNLSTELEKIADGNSEAKSYQDDRFWRAQVDKAGNGHARIRFLPAIEEETIPWVKYFSHGFKDIGGWYIENCRTSIGEKDPVADANNVLWETGLEANKNLARDRKRRLHYVSNILVIDDPENPENNSKVFLFKYGKKIFDKINDVMHPEFADEEAINPFDFWEGANFKLRIRKVDGFTNYDKSEFESVKVLHEDDEALEKLWATEYPLKPFLEEENYKPYSLLKEKFEKVIGLNNDHDARITAEDLEPEDDDIPIGGEDEVTVPDSEEAPGDVMDFFDKLANED